ncbi:unnamed protein product [Auanema sp. JU1783]|nr:unnamed protein product [Auanema sp. JU1783]
MLAKLRRYVLHPIVMKCRLEELLKLIALALLFSILYVLLFGSSYDIRDVVDRTKFTQTSIGYARPRMIRNDFVAAVLVMCATRAHAIDNHLKLLTKYRPSNTAFPIIVSQDGDMTSVKNVISTYITSSSNITYMQHERKTSQGAAKNYPLITAHYKWAFQKVFNEMKYDYVIVTEDDLEISSDFFSYFAWGKRALEADESLWCVSAWNDNGLPGSIDGRTPDLTWRTDFFPGLGWLLSRKLWEELESGWPDAYWDDWMRKPEVRKGRSCIRPEIPRTSHNMELAGKGSSGGLYKQILKQITHSNVAVNFDLIPVRNMVKDRFDKYLSKLLVESHTIKLTASTASSLKETEFDVSHSYKIVYDNVRTWYNIGNILGIMVDIRGGMPRTAYDGVVSTMYKGCRLYIIPENLDIHNIDSFKYNSTWDLQLRYIEFEKTYCRPGRFLGDCDPYSDDMKQYFKKRRHSTKLENWLPLVRMFKLCALVAISSVLVSYAVERNLRTASNLLPHGVNHPPRERQFQIQIPGLDEPSKIRKSKRSESRIKRNVGGYAQSGGQYGGAPPQYFQPQPQPSYSQAAQPQPSYSQAAPQPSYSQGPQAPQQAYLAPPQGYQAPQSQQTVVSYYRPPQQQSVYQQQRLGVQVPPPIQQKSVAYQQQPQIQQRPNNAISVQPQVHYQPQVAPAPVQQRVHQGAYQEGPYAGRKEVIQQRTTIYQQRPQTLPNAARPVIRPAAKPYQRFMVAPNPSNGGYDNEGYQETVPQIQQRPEVPQPRPQPPRPQPSVQLTEEGYGPSDQIQVSPAPVIPVTVTNAPALPAQPNYIEEPYVPVQPVRTSPPVTRPPVTRAPTTQPPPPPPPVQTTPTYDEPEPETEAPAPYDEPAPVEEECFYNPSGYICCNELLNDLMVETYQELENRPKFHTCNVQALVNTLQKKLEDAFKTPFETIAAYDDFSQRINYKKDLVCKVELNGRYILAYAAVGADETKKVVRSISI